MPKSKYYDVSKTNRSYCSASLTHPIFYATIPLQQQNKPNLTDRGAGAKSTLPKAAGNGCKGKE